MAITISMTKDIRSIQQIYTPNMSNLVNPVGCTGGEYCKIGSSCKYACDAVNFVVHLNNLMHSIR